MTTQIFLILLTAFAVITSLLTQGVKYFLDGVKVNYASNIVVLIIAVLVGVCGMLVYYTINGIPFIATNIVYIFLMALANWLGAMLGYDKVKQAIQQITKGGL